MWGGFIPMQSNSLGSLASFRGPSPSLRTPREHPMIGRLSIRILGPSPGLVGNLTPEPSPHDPKFP